MATILVVDDEPAVRRVVRTTLETRSHAVSVAEDGSHALAAVSHERPDLI
jgi:two-component system KDP operon response regulator KdpE